MPKQTFFQRAEKLGHSVDRLKAGYAIRSHVTIPDVDALRDFLDDGSDSDARAVNETRLCGDDPPPPQSDASQGAILRRVHAFVYGNTELSDQDRELVSQAFPMQLEAVSDPAPQTYSGRNVLATSGNPVVFNFSTVTFNDQAYVTIYNTPLTFTCDNIVRNGAPPTGFGDFNILGATGGTGTTGPVGSAGGAGGGGKDGNCSSAGIAGDSGQNGNTGTVGNTGTSGGTGNAGLASLPATITITNGFTGTSNLIVLTRSGTGGIGGQGGTGGQGGQGGKGGNGATCGCTGSGAGNGAPGGTGGAGGPGGMGGNATAAAGNIIVKVPAAQANSIIQLMYTAPPGAGGTGGAGGAGGAGGGAGSGGKHNSDGSGGPTGTSGAQGATGTQGTSAGAPGQISVQPL